MKKTEALNMRASEEDLRLVKLGAAREHRSMAGYIFKLVRDDAERSKQKKAS